MDGDLEERSIYHGNNFFADKDNFETIVSMHAPG
jgi:hypothetical protein